MHLYNTSDSKTSGDFSKVQNQILDRYSKQGKLPLYTNTVQVGGDIVLNTI